MINNREIVYHIAKTALAEMQALFYLPYTECFLTLQYETVCFSLFWARCIVCISRNTVHAVNAYLFDNVHIFFKVLCIAFRLLFLYNVLVEIYLYPKERRINEKDLHRSTVFSTTPLTTSTKHTWVTADDKKEISGEITLASYETLILARKI